MLPLLSFFTLAQTIAAPIPLPSSPGSPNFPSSPPRVPPPEDVIPPQEPRSLPQETLPSQEVFQPQDIRPLPGQLDTVPVFNSNSPELVQTEGILLSTFPPDGKTEPAAHLNFPFQGRFDFFSHHIARARSAGDTRTLFQGVLVYNPTYQPITIDILQGASYLTRPDALFVDLPPYVDDPTGRVYAGPGSRVISDILHGRRQGNWPAVTVIPPRESWMLMNLPIPVGTVAPGSNGRSTLLRLWSSGPVYMASMAMYAPLNPNKTERSPTLEEWQNLLVNGGLAGPRDIPPTPMDKLKEYARIVYGRVSGVALGSEWKANITDNSKTDYLSIPKRGRAFSYGLSTLYQGTFGTGQVQSASLVARYPDTAYQANGNYGIQYSLTLPLNNTTGQKQVVTVSIQTPLKQDKAKGGLLFFTTPDDRVFFRGPVRIRYTDDHGAPQTRYVHLIQQRGQAGQPLVTLTMPKNDRRLIQVDLLYPPDSTPPQVLTIATLNNS